MGKEEESKKEKGVAGNRLQNYVLVFDDLSI